MSWIVFESVAGISLSKNVVFDKFSALFNSSAGLDVGISTIFGAKYSAESSDVVACVGTVLDAEEDASEVDEWAGVVDDGGVGLVEGGSSELLDEGAGVVDADGVGLAEVGSSEVLDEGAGVGDAVVVGSGAMVVTLPLSLWPAKEIQKKIYTQQNSQLVKDILLLLQLTKPIVRPITNIPKVADRRIKIFSRPDRLPKQEPLKP